MSYRIGALLLGGAVAASMGCGADAPDAATGSPQKSEPIGEAQQRWELTSVNDETQNTHLWIVDTGLRMIRDNRPPPPAARRATC